MKRLAYLNTAKGQRSQFERRSHTRHRFSISQTLRGKGSMKAAEKTAFQQAVLADLERFGHPTFRAPLVAELTFYSSQNNPPQLHTLAKNYLDLLGSTGNSVVGPRKYLAFRDDRQVKMLSVSYHLWPSERSPAIHVELGKLSDLRRDLELVERIRRDDFEDDEDDWPWSRSTRSSYEGAPEDRAAEEMNEAFDSYQDVMRNNWGRNLPPDMIALMREMEQQQLQARYLAWSELVVRRSVLGLLRRARGRTAAAVAEAVGAAGRGLLLSDPITLELPHAPMVSGDTARFVADVSAALDGFSTRRPWLFPLRVPVSAIILVVPPPNGIDLDNLARKIVPLVHNRWQPPRTQLAHVDVTQIPDPRLQTLITSQLTAERRFPRTSLTRYEVVELPRLPADPPGGFVRISLGSGSPTTIRDTIDELIDDWARSVD